MAKRALMEFKRGTGVTHTFKMPIADYVAGSSLYFTAKPAIDNDLADGSAVINKTFTDASVTLDSVYAVYLLEFDAIDIVGVTFASGEDEKEYFGEFKYVAPGEDPVTFPSNNDYIDVRIYANIRLA